MRRPVELPRGRRRLRQLGLAGLLAWLWLLASGPAVGAHALLRDSDPADGASLDRAPRQVLLTFTERPEPQLSTVHVLDTAGRQVEAAKAAPVAGQPLQLVVPLGELPDGTYTVSWRVLSADDGHVTAGSFAFGVGEAASPAATATQTGPAGEGEAPSPLAVAGRWALYGGLVLLVGAAATGLAVFRRTLPTAARPLLAVAAGLAVAGLAARFVAEYTTVDAPLGDLLASSTGRGLLRLAVGVAVAVVAATLLADRAGPPARPAASGLEGQGEPAAAQRPGSSGGSEDAGGAARVEPWGLWLVAAASAAAMLLHVLAGHAAGPSSLRPLNLLTQWVHLLAIGAWIGGLVWLLAGLRGRERADQASVVVRFSKLAAPVLAVVALTGLARALDLAGGWTGLLDSSYGRVLDVKVLLFLGLVALGALNRYRIVPALAASRRSSGEAQGEADTGRAERLEMLRRNVRGEVALAACVLAAAAVLSQLPPGKFVAGQVAARPPPQPPSVQVEGNDFATSVRLDLTVSPGTAGPNSFTAKVTDYDSGEPWPASRVALRFTPRDRPEIGGATLELARGGDGLWQGKGSMLSIDGPWVVVALVQAPGSSVTVPLELRTRSASQQVEVSKVPGQPTLYTIDLPTGGTLQSYLDPGRPGANTVHFTFFTAGGGEQTMDQVHATMTTAGATRALELLSLGTGHFAANVDLEPGEVSFAVDGSTDREVAVSGRFQQRIE
jgi:putative copper export protein/methionine-rich copper-binding protein CopC